MTKLTVKTVAAELEKAMGNISAVARVFGVTRGAVYNFINRHSSLLEVVHDARESMLDNAESGLHVRILDKESWAIQFALKTLGRTRGYAEHQDFHFKDESDYSKLTPEEVNAMIAEYERQNRQNGLPPPPAGEGQEPGPG